MERTSRTRLGRASAMTGPALVVADRRNRPRLLFMMSSLFQPPWFCASWKSRIVPSGKPALLAHWNTAFRSTLRRPGPASMPQAVSSLPSIANSAGPVTRFLPDLSSKFGSSGASGCSKSAVALENFTGTLFVGFFASRASTLNSVRAQVPLNDRPGPLHGRLGSVSSSSRNAVIF